MLGRIGRVVVTGGAGFIGSHLVDALMSGGIHVIVIDNLSSGSISNLSAWKNNPNFEFLRVDLEDQDTLAGTKATADILFHLAANPEVRAAESDPKGYVEQHLKTLRNVLDFCRSRDISTCIFASSSTVYGDAEILPTPDDYENLNPISVYGKMKLQCERLLTEACERGRLRGLILRYANIVGPRSRHGVIYDLVKKLKLNPNQLEVLGDGTQKKSYLYVSDCIEASLLAAQSHSASSQKSYILNVGSEDWIEVARIAELVCEAMDLKGVRFHYKPATEDGRGWMGDVREMQLDISRLKRLGWRPKHSSEEAVRLAAESAALELR